MAPALVSQAVNTHRRRRWLGLGLAVSVLTTLYCFSGVVMNAHFSMLGSEAQSAGHVLAAKIFAALTLVGLLATLSCLIALWRTRPSRTAI